MMDYGELVKALREHSKRYSNCDTCFAYDAKMRWYTTCSEELTEKAADAIEELNAEVEALKHDIERYIQINTELNGDYEELLHAAKKCTHGFFSIRSMNRRRMTSAV